MGAVWPAAMAGWGMLPVALPAGSAPVSEKRIGLNRGPPAWAMGIGWGSSAFPRRDVLAHGRCVARCHGRMGDVARSAPGWFRAGERKTDWTKPRTARLGYGYWMGLISLPTARRVGPWALCGPLPWQDGGCCP